ncbi:MAG: hypothetical protein F4W96_09760 [Chloroflexi bacterium]|nr:hypothetical protein [Chloroflexota bacterium]
MKHAERVEYIRAAERTAHSLGLPSHGPSTDLAIVDYCRQEVSRLVSAHGGGLPPTMDGLLGRVATCLDVEIVEIHGPDDIRQLLERVPPTAEPVMALVDDELNDETDAITIRRQKPGPWHRYLAIINCQGQHYQRRFFTKWHELAHRLVDGEQLMLAFRHTTDVRKDPGEILVDKVAGELAFFPEIVGPHAERCLRQHGFTFEAVDALQTAVAPEASQQATALALMRHMNDPAWYLRSAVSLNRTEARIAIRRIGKARPTPLLRIQEVVGNDAAWSCGTRIHQWMRVPPSSLITSALRSGTPRTGTELLDDWVTSRGGPIGSGSLTVDAQVAGEQVLALASLSDH